MGDCLEILPKTVRDILKVNNDEIIKLCKMGNISLKQNTKGLTYFTTNDVKTLKKLQEINNKAYLLENNSNKSSENSKNLPSKNEETVVLLKQITDAVKNIENGFYSKFAAILEEKLEDKLDTKLDEKLAGMDAVIMDLVRCKAEAEDMRKKLAKNDKEIYKLKNQLSSFKKVAGNIYIKNKAKEIFSL